MEKSCFYNDNDYHESTLHTSSLFNFDEAWAQAYRYTEEQAYIELDRQPDTFITMINALEMRNYLALSESEAWDSYEAEEARKSN